MWKKKTWNAWKCSIKKYKNCKFERLGCAAPSTTLAIPYLRLKISPAQDPFYRTSHVIQVAFRKNLSIHSESKVQRTRITMWTVLSFSSTIFPSYRILIHLTSDKLGKDMLKAQDSLSNWSTHLDVALSPSNSTPQREVWSTGLWRDARPSLIVNPLILLQPPIEYIQCWQKKRKNIDGHILHVTIRENFHTELNKNSPNRMIIHRPQTQI